MIGDSKDETSQEQAAETLGISKKRKRELQHIYDWSALKQIVRRCPRNDNVIQVQDLFNLIDMSFESNQGIYSGGNFVRPESIPLVRNMLVLLITIIHKLNYQQIIKDENLQNVYNQYYTFAKRLSDMMIKEGLTRKETHQLNEREFYMFSYAVISMNWDPLLLWFVFNAHKETNDAIGGVGVGNPPERMKLFNDLAHFMAVRSVDGQDPAPWYPMNETVVQRLNDPIHKQTGRRVRIGKFYFPHGSHGFRECPNCGKLTFYLGDEWNVLSDSLFPPSVLPSLSCDNNIRSKEEEDAYDKGIYDAVQCSHCGSMTEAHHTPIVMQTNYKGNHPPYIEEIQRDMKISISKAKHIILFGYSLPEDDVQYRSILMAKGNQNVRCSIVNFHHDAEDKWLHGDQLDQFMKDVKAKDDNLKVIDHVRELFGKDNVRAYLHGIPNVFLEKGEVSEHKMKQLMEWN